MKLLLAIALICLSQPVFAGYQLAENGCQCTGACSGTLGFAGKCSVGPECGGGDTNCDTGSWLNSALNSVSDFFTGVASSGMVTKVTHWTKENFAKVDVQWVKDNFADLQTKLGDFSAEQLKDVDVGQITADGWESLKDNLGAVAEWTGEKVKQIPVSEMANWTSTQIKKIPVESMTSFTVEQLESIPWDEIGGFTKAQWDKIPAEDIAQFSWEQLQQVPYDRIGEFTKEQWDKVPVESVIKFTGDQINKIPADKLAGIQGYWDMAPVAQVSQWTAEMLVAAGVENLDPEQVGAVAGSVWRSVPVGEMAKLSAQGLQAIDYDGLAEFTDEQWKSIPFDTLISTTGQKIRAIPPSTVHEWTEEQWAKIPVDKMIMFTGDQLNNVATLGKLSTDALFEYYKSGNLDTSLLSAEAKAQLDELIAQANDAELLAKGQDTINAVVDWESSKEEHQDAIIKLSELESTPDVTPEQLKEQADKVAEAAATEAEKLTAAVEKGFVPHEEEGEDDGSGASRASFGVVSVALGVLVLAGAGAV